MNKNKITAIGLVAIAFIAFFWAFMSFENGSPIVNLFAFVVVIGTTFASIAVGNAGER